MFDSSGTMLRQFGRAGSGPEEFVALRGAWPYAGDSLYTFDALTARATIWTGGGDYVRTVYVYAEGIPMSLGRAGDTGFVAVVRERAERLPSQPGERSLNYMNVYVLDGSGEPLLELGRLPFDETYVWSPTEGRRTITVIPFGPKENHAHGKRDFYYGWPTEWRILRFRHDGSGVDTLNIDRPLRPLTVGIVNQALDSLLEDMERERRPEFRRNFRTFPLPSNLPAFDRIIEADDGLLWVREYRILNWSETTWLVVSPTGSLVAQVSIPGSFEPMHIGSDFIAGVGRDALDREQVLVLSLQRRP
jgi:hypothetical protein